MSKPQLVIEKTKLSQALSVLTRIGQTLVAIQDLSKTLKQIAENAKDVLGADIVDLYEYIQAQNEFVLPPVLVGERKNPFILKEKIYEDDVAVQVVKAGKPEYFSDAQKTKSLTGKFIVPRADAPEQRFVIREGIISSVSLPLLAGKETVGVMFVNYRSQQSFDNEQKNIIESFSNLAAIAIYNARLYRDDQIRAKALARLSKLSEQLVSIGDEHKDVRKLLEDIAISAKEVLKADIIELYEYSQAKNSYELPQISIGERRGPFVPKDKVYEDDAVLALINQNQPSYIKEAQADAIATSDYTITRSDKPNQRFAVREAILSTAAIPLKSGDEAVGLMFANYRISQEFTDEQKELIELFANQAAIAIQNTRLNARSYKSRETLITFGRKLTSGIRLNEEEILNLIHKQASELMDTANMYVALYDEEKDEVRFGLMYKDGNRIEVPPRKAGKGRTEEIIRTREPIFIPTREESIKWYSVPGREEYIGDPLASWIGVPMMSEEKVLGVIATYHPTNDHVYQEDDLEILQGIADQAEVAIENARLYNKLEKLNSEMARTNKELLEANTKIAEKEAVLVRTMIASDFVHRLNNLAGTIPIWVEKIRNRLNSQAPQDEALVNYINNYLSKIDEDTDRLLRAGEQLKSPPKIETISLDEMLGSLVRQARVQMPAKIEIELDIQNKLPLIRAVTSELTSALWNVIDNGIDAMPNGGLMNITANVSQTPDKIHWANIQISDQGRGILPEDQHKVFLPFQSTKPGHMGYGLWSTRNIVERIGGTIEFENNKDFGTTFIIKLPGQES